MSAVRADGWLSLPISEIADFRSGDLISVSQLSERSAASPIPVFGGNGVAGYTSSSTVSQPTVILGRVGQKCGVVYRNSGPAWITDNALYARRFKRPLDVRFLALALEAARLNDVRNRNDLPLITQSILGDVKLSWPESLEDQSHIADVVSDANETIAALERLITKKQAIKQGMMQQLFRDRADSAQWTPIGSVTSWLSGGTPDRSNGSYWAGTIPWISATTLKRMEVSDSDQKVSALGVRAGSKMAPLESTLVLVRGSALHSEIRASLVTAPVCFNQDVKALVPSAKIVPKFLTYSIHGNADRLLRLVTSAGNTAGVLDTAVLKSFAIWLPDRDEQQRVVAMFDDVTRDLDVLSERLVKAKCIKQGMMQELLTGRTRLPVAEAAS
jgi:type I restriction enzyme S subunit